MRRLRDEGEGGVNALDLLSRELLAELHTRLAQRPTSRDDLERAIGLRQTLQAMTDDREAELRAALDAIADTITPEGALEASPLVIALIQLPAELALLRAALTT